MKIEKETRRRQRIGKLMSEAERLAAFGQYREASKLGRQILRYDHAHLGALELMARILWQTSQLDDLLPTLDCLIVANPYEPGYHLMKGAALQSLGRLGEAASCFKRAVDFGHGPDRERALSALAELQEWQKALLSDLLAEDPAFVAGYAIDPERACLDRGFVLMPDLPQARAAGAVGIPS
ncbi:MAG: hypothetical protein JSS72_06690 [Armatimonadetes bacterium]|nr:hypothetical protein [Armatimonadota bacterium]